MRRSDNGTVDCLFFVDLVQLIMWEWILLKYHQHTDQSNITSLAAATIGYRLLCLLRDKKIVEKSFSFGNYLNKK